MPGPTAAASGARCFRPDRRRAARHRPAGHRRGQCALNRAARMKSGQELPHSAIAPCALQEDIIVLTLRSTRAALIGLLALAAGAAGAQTYPNGSVRLIVPVPAGGVTDTMARIVAQRLTNVASPSSSTTVREGTIPLACRRCAPPRTGSRCWWSRTPLSPPTRICSASFHTIRSRTSTYYRAVPDQPVLVINEYHCGEERG